MGVLNKNHLLDSRQYEVEYLEDETEVLAQNKINENVPSQVYEKYHIHFIIDGKMDHRISDDDVPKRKRTITTQLSRRQITVGLEVTII